MSSLSLQTHLVRLQPSPMAIAVDPRGFKTALQSFTNFLIDRQVPATLWLKLPKDDAWWVDVWQYGQQAAGCTLYTLGDQIGSPPNNLAASLRPIPIAQTAELKREYLCLAVASNFVGALFAVRTPSSTPTSDKRTLKLYCMTEGSSVSALGAGIKHLFEKSLPSESVSDCVVAGADEIQPGEIQSSDYPERAESVSQDTPPEFIAVKAALSQWDRCFPRELLSQETLPLTSSFLMWQLQFQEELRSQIATYRNATPVATHTALSSITPSFLAQARQELQVPLTTVKTALTLLGAPTLKLAQRQRYLDMISQQCDHQKALINSIIELLQIQTAATSSPQSLQLADIIPGIVSTYQPIAEESGIMLAYTVPPALAEVSGIEAELKQVVIHLINNGIQITPKGGRVWVAAAPHDANFVALTIQDSGEGIPKAEIDNLFEAFYRMPTGNGEAGAGLGLTMVQQLVRRMNGSISVESPPGKGTTFKILLPRYQVATGGSGKAPVSRAEPAQTATLASV